MRIPSRLESLIEDGLIDSVIRSLKSGKEADVYVVEVKDDLYCAKIYKEATHRSFQSQTLYQEGRKSKNSRNHRAMSKHSKFGRKAQEEQWQQGEVATLKRLYDAGMRVPKPLWCVDGVLLMEMICDEEGYPAPRLNDVEMDEKTALAFHATLIGDVVKMLCAGVIHGDLSEFNILVDTQGPVVIDFPQAVDAACNNNAYEMLLRDVTNLATYFGAFAPELLKTTYAQEIWDLYKQGLLTPQTPLTGDFKESEESANVHEIIDEIEFARKEAIQAALLKKRLENQI